MKTIMWRKEEKLNLYTYLSVMLLQEELTQILQIKPSREDYKKVVWEIRLAPLYFLRLKKG